MAGPDRIFLSQPERDSLTAAAGADDARRALRARIVLACAAAARSNSGIAAEVGASLPTVRLWRARFLARRVDGLSDAPRPGAPRRAPADRLAEAVRRAGQAEAGGGRASTRTLARELGLSQSSVSRALHANRGAAAQAGQGAAATRPATDRPRVEVESPAELAVYIRGRFADGRWRSPDDMATVCEAAAIVPPHVAVRFLLARYPRRGRVLAQQPNRTSLGTAELVRAALSLMVRRSWVESRRVGVGARTETQYQIRPPR